MEAKKTHIICFHLLNNYSGSPFILSLIIRCLKENQNNVTLYTSKSKGFLSDISKIKYHSLLYRWKENIILLSIILIISQLHLFFITLFRYSFKKNQIFYINTLSPFGAALAGWFLNKKIIYHVHENYIRPSILHKFTFFVMQLTASEVIFVSNYLKQITLIKQPSYILPNSLSVEFCNVSNSFLKGRTNKARPLKNILMVSSLKTYKGILIQLELAKRLPEYEFCLVAGASLKDVTSFIDMNELPRNFSIYSEQSNLHPFYQKADLMLNLTIPSQCIETFGLTILEGMAYGLPIIAPPVGGPSELVKNGINGYLVNPLETEQLVLSIRQIFNSEGIYNNFSEASLIRSKDYSYQKIKKQLINIISN